MFEENKYNNKMTKDQQNRWFPNYELIPTIIKTLNREVEKQHKESIVIFKDIIFDEKQRSC